MRLPQDDSREPQPAGPVRDEGGALRAGHGPSSTPPSSRPPTGGDSTGDAQGAGAGASPPGAGSSEGQGAQVEHDIEGLLADTQQERDEYLELAKRTKADFENYRKRVAAEVQAASTRGKAELAAQLIGVIDNLERALAAAGVEPGGDRAPAEPLAEGFFLTYRELCTALERSGVESFDPTGEPFDPNRHEALQKSAVEGAASGTVVEVMQKGYRLGDQLIRPARVVVAE